MYFHKLFHLQVFLKKIENSCLNLCTKQALRLVHVYFLGNLQTNIVERNQGGL